MPFTEHSNHYGSELIFDLQYGREGTDEPLAVHGGDLQVVEVVRLQVGHHLAVDGVLDGHVGGELAVAENEDLGKREKEKGEERKVHFVLSPTQSQYRI